MSTTRRVILLLTVVVAAFFSIHTETLAQSDQLTAEDSLQALDPANVPEYGSFFRLSDYLANEGSLGPPWPFLMTNAPVYSLDGNSFLVDDAVIANDDQLLNALSLLVQPQDQFSAQIMSASSLDPGDGSNTNSSGGWTNNAQTSVMPTNGLYLTIDGVINDEAYINLMNTDSNSVYEVLSAEQLGSNSLNFWTSEGAVDGADGITSTKVPTLGRNNLFLSARNITLDTSGQGLPDYWQAQYFGTNGIDPWQYDPAEDGWTFFDDYQNGFDPRQWHTPPTPAGLTAQFNANNGTAIVSWLPSPGPVQSYTIQKHDAVNHITTNLNFAAGTTSFEVLPKIRTSGLNRKHTGNDPAQTEQTDASEVLRRV